MSRIRTIKPDFWTDPELSECSMSARLLFIGLWNFADDYGNLEAHPLKVKAQVFPLDKIKIEPLLKELENQKFIILYSASARNYYHIRNFQKHQKINRPSNPTCPIFNDSLRTHGGLTEDSPLEGKGKEGKGKEGKIKTSLPADFLISDPVRKWAEGKGFSSLDEHLAVFKRKCLAKGYKYLDWDSAFMEAIREDWAKLRQEGENGANKYGDGAHTSKTDKYAGRTEKILL